ncbi:MAG: LamG-like jellyroll fold domain-containing protein, partial [Christensenellales bacterium]
NVSYYASALTAEQVGFLNDSGNGGNTPGGIDANELRAPIGAWDFTQDDETGTRDEFVKAIADRSGNHAPLLMQNSARFQSDDKFGSVIKAGNYAYNLNGQYDINNGFTVALWVYADALIPNSFLINNVVYNRTGSGDSLTHEWDIHVNSEGRIAWEMNGGLNWFSITGADASDALTTGEWVHLAVAYDAEEYKMYGYVNGELKNSQSVVLPENMVNTEKDGGLVVGTMASNIQGMYNSAYTFKGKIAEVRIYDIAYGRTVVQSVMNGTDLADSADLGMEKAESLPEGNLTAGWNADEGEGEFINDISGNYNHAILGTDVSWMSDFSGIYENVVSPGYAVSEYAHDFSENSTFVANMKINATHNGFGTVISSRAEARYHELGYLGKDFYIDSNASRWNIHVNTLGRICFDCQGAWDLGLIEVPYCVVPADISSEGWVRLAITVEKPETETGYYVFRFYLDGHLVGIAYRETGISAPESGDGTVMFANPDAGNNFQGNLTEFRFYNTVLTEEEIALLCDGDNIETPANRGLTVIKQFVPAESYAVGDVITIRISDYIRNDAWSELAYDAYVTDNTGEKVGKIEDGVFTFELKKAKEGMGITISVRGGLQHAEMSFRLNITEQAKGGCGGIVFTGSTGTGIMLAVTCLVAVFLTLGKKKYGLA